jgi:ribosomal protein L2
MHESLAAQLLENSQKKRVEEIKVSAHCSQAQPIPSYFVVMIDYGRKGREAVVDPEITRREVVARILSREYDPERICFIHHVTEAGAEDVTFSVIADAAHAALEVA